MNNAWYDLGELAELVSRLIGHSSAITLTPVLRETDRFIGGLDPHGTVLIVDHWEISYSYGGSDEVAAGPTLREAVDSALADLNRRAADENE